ncbi:tRNA (guanosine(46)-N(7))-methyltransferase TrmB [uncultured Martelella sp.]|uniref:tRNA (guanine(46)-N(7))-methyltransferase TrmB n=1 Tax=uncultured Martelella sp. TaxID=392331 RepID=UPI0029C826C3|nr:tRNA (guanosine(46)-N(7))-methyltransferase TrmB [uncultured Martelella sp.]
MSDNSQHQAGKAFFGRRKGKPLRDRQARNLAEVLPALALDPHGSALQDPRALFAAEVGTVRLEIGFGGGEHLLHRVRENPEIGFIGIEPFVNSMAKLLGQVEGSEPPNLRLYDDDAVTVLDWLPDASLDHIDLLYPDPWPKRRHWKRRFVSSVNLDRFYRVLKPGGRFCFASDIDSYINWTLLHCRDHGGFDWQARSSEDWLRPYENWPGTRYEAKARREGRSSAYLTFVKV